MTAEDMAAELGAKMACHVCWSWEWRGMTCGWHVFLTKADCARHFIASAAGVHAMNLLRDGNL
jgi:hypothetical protein